MQKIKPHFQLDWSFKDSFVVQSVILSDVVIKVKYIEKVPSI